MEAEGAEGAREEIERGAETGRGREGGEEEEEDGLERGREAKPES